MLPSSVALGDGESALRQKFTVERMFGARAISCAVESFNILTDFALTGLPTPLLSDEEFLVAQKLDHILIFAPSGLTMGSLLDLTENRTSTGTRLIVPPDPERNGEDVRGYSLEETLNGEWWLVGKPVPGSRGKNYLEQTSAIADYLPSVFGKDPPLFVKEALEEFRAEENGLAMRTMTATTAVVKRLSSLKINQLFRPSPVLLFWLMILYERINNGKHLLEDTLSWTNTLVPTEGKISPKRAGTWPVVFGRFDNKGARLLLNDPLEPDQDVGACFARKVPSV